MTKNKQISRVKRAMIDSLLLYYFEAENYLKNYFINKYGAITDVDFSDIFEKYMNQERK